MSALRVSWMWADSGLLGERSVLAKVDPLRWSTCAQISDATSDLQNHTKVIVVMTSTIKANKIDQTFDTPQDAAQQIHDMEEYLLKWRWSNRKAVSFWSREMDAEALKSDLGKHFSVTSRPILAEIREGDEVLAKIRFNDIKDAVNKLSQLEMLDAHVHNDASNKVSSWAKNEWHEDLGDPVLDNALYSIALKRSGIVAWWMWNDAGLLGETSVLAKKNALRKSSNLTIPAIRIDISNHIGFIVKVTNGSTSQEFTCKDTQEAIDFFDSEPICKDGESMAQWKLTNGGILSSGWSKPDAVEAIKVQLLKKSPSARPVCVEVSGTDAFVIQKNFEDAPTALRMLGALETKILQEHCEACKILREQVASYVQEEDEARQKVLDGSG